MRYEIGSANSETISRRRAALRQQAAYNGRRCHAGQRVIADAVWWWKTQGRLPRVSARKRRWNCNRSKMVFGFSLARGSIAAEPARSV